MDIAVGARMRVHGLDERAARDPRAGTLVGRLLVRGVLSADQYDAAQVLIVARGAYQRAIQAKEDNPQPAPELPMGGDFDAFCKAAVERYDSLMAFIDGFMRDARIPRRVIDMIVRDIDFPHFHADLGRLLAALAAHLAAPRKRARGA